MRKYFGTDGVRGRVGQAPMTVDFALRLASAAARVLAPSGGSVLIGKDTRLSGYMFESALEAGFVAAGVDGIAGRAAADAGHRLSVSPRCARDFGVVISASHNPYHDNGIKFFDGAGDKLSDDLEAAIEASDRRGSDHAILAALGQAKRIDSARTDYQWFCRSTVAEGVDFTGCRSSSIAPMARPTRWRRGCLPNSART